MYPILNFRYICNIKMISLIPKHIIMETQEKKFNGLKVPGFLAVFGTAILIGISIILYANTENVGTWAALVGLFLNITTTFFCWGFLQIEPNDARVILFFGKYVGTIKENGFFWINPLYKKMHITLRAKNLDVEPIKVNDKAGNPVMIGLVLVWKISDTYKASFDIATAHENFVMVQSDSALRKMASLYAYDDHESKNTVTLRSGGNEVNEELEREVSERLAIAGIEVVEARINYLAYASEIAGVMLRRQQADAIISAREKIVEGAVSMVQMALKKLSEEEIVDLDEDKKAAMVSNLLVVLCADEAAQPVINTGTLHQ